MATELDPMANAIGDSFLNKCLAGVPFFDKLSNTITPIFGWTQPYSLMVMTSIVLVVLPLVFRVGSKSSFSKISRIYNFIRLGFLSLFHQIGYSYTLATPMAFIINQGTPCILDSEFDSDPSLTMFPASFIVSGSMFCFGVARYSAIRPLIGLSICSVFLILLSIATIAARLCTIFQAVTSIFLSYVLHAVHLRIPFKFVHIENIILFLFLVCSALVCSFVWQWDFFHVFYEHLFSVMVIVVDEVMLIRHYRTRGGFSAIERPADLYWSIEPSHGETMRLLNSEEEENFIRNLQSDTRTAVFSAVTVFVCVLLRRLSTPAFFDLAR
jgi:hypothetical protein